MMQPETRQQLYRVFARFKDESHLAREVGISNPLHLLTEADFDALGRELDLTVLLYDPPILRHFLPRILEFNDFFVSNDVAQLGSHRNRFDLESKLRRLGWRQWPAQEVEILRAVWREWTATEIANGQRPGFVFWFLSKIGEDLNSYFDLWLDARPVEVAAFLLNCDWNDANDSAVQWAKNPRVGARLEAAFYENLDARESEILSRAVTFVGNMRAFEAQTP